MYNDRSAYKPREKTDVFMTNPSRSTRFGGVLGEMLTFCEERQLLDVSLWKRFVDQYKDADADYENGWRGEYWGKMMRGATYVYQCTHNAELYKIMKDTVLDMISAADENGRISTYAPSHELQGWDLWCRKYVLLGMQYFGEICSDEDVKARILLSMTRQADCILEKVGKNEGQIDICEATNNWRGLNSCSILEPMVRLYSMTKDKRYLDFSSYIVETGFTQCANIWKLALEDHLYPYQYPQTKAYEMMSCFEGLLEYYRVTGVEMYRDAVIRFADRILRSDYTIIGSCGCTHELFDHSTVRQTNTTNEKIMQETCVTVTLMKFFSQLTLLTGKAKYMDAAEQSLYNAYFGSFNTDGCQCGKVLSENPNWKHIPLPFDSYSPLTAGMRANGIGGLKVMKDRHYYGCCACIASAGAGVMGKMACLQTKKGLVINIYSEGVYCAKTPEGQDVSFSVSTAYPVDGQIFISLHMEKAENFSLLLRIPSWSKNTALTVNGAEKRVSRGYTSVRRTWKDGDTLSLSLDMRVKVIRPVSYKHDILMNKVLWKYDMIVPVYDVEDPLAKQHFALKYGPLVLAQDARLGYDLHSPVSISPDKDSYIAAVHVSSDNIPFAHKLALAIPCGNGETMTVVDYASAGKTWNEQSELAAWMFGTAE